MKQQHGRTRAADHGVDLGARGFDSFVAEPGGKKLHKWWPFTGGLRRLRIGLGANQRGRAAGQNSLLQQMTSRLSGTFVGHVRTSLRYLISITINTA